MANCPFLHWRPWPIAKQEVKQETEFFPLHDCKRHNSDSCSNRQQVTFYRSRRDDDSSVCGYDSDSSPPRPQVLGNRNNSIPGVSSWRRLYGHYSPVIELKKWLKHRMSLLMLKIYSRSLITKKFFNRLMVCQSAGLHIFRTSCKLLSINIHDLVQGRN